MKKLLVLFFLSVFLFLLTKHSYAVEYCTGQVKDTQNNPIPKATILVIYSSDNPQTFETSDVGGYSIRVGGFGKGGGLAGDIVKEMDFSKDGFQTQKIGTSLTGQCPGNVVLEKPSGLSSGYSCDPKEGCVQTTDNSQYPTQSACSDDCKHKKYNSFTDTCDLATNLWYRQSLECKGKVQVPIEKTPTPHLKSPCGDNFVSCLTAFGPIRTDPAKFVKDLFSILLSLAGGAAILLIIVSGYRVMASQGNPEKVKEAQEQLTSAIVGLLFIIFSLTILQIIGVDILHIPGFQK